MSSSVKKLLIVLSVFVIADIGLVVLLLNKKGNDSPNTDSASPLLSYTTTTTTTAVTTTVTTEAAESEAESVPDESTPDSSDAESKEEEPAAALYILNESAPLLSDGLKEIYRANKGDMFTGVPDKDNPDYIRIDYMYDTKLVSKDKVTKNENAVVLHIAAIGQRGGSTDGFSACGPTAAAILVDWQKGEKTTKDELIRYAESHGLDNQGKLTSQTGGMSSDKVIELINSFYGGLYKAQNVYNDLPVAKLTDLINNGHIAMISIKYTGQIVDKAPNALVHFVVVCGYEEFDDGKYFYYVDPFYGNGGRSVFKVKASLIEDSMKNVTNEPATMIIVE